MLRGYIRQHKRHSTSAQATALDGAGVSGRNVYVEGHDGDTIAEAIKALRKGDALVVLHLYLVAPPRRTTRDSPRRALVETLQAIEAKGAVVFEASTGRSTATDRDEMLLDAIDDLTSAARSKRSVANGARSPGRPRAEFTPAEIEQAKHAWFDIRHERVADVAKHLPKGFAVWRCYDVFGPRHGAQK